MYSLRSFSMCLFVLGFVWCGCGFRFVLFVVYSDVLLCSGVLLRFCVCGGVVLEFVCVRVLFCLIWCGLCLFVFGVGVV